MGGMKSIIKKSKKSPEAIQKRWKVLSDRQDERKEKKEAARAKRLQSQKEYEKRMEERRNPTPPPPQMTLTQKLKWWLE